MGCPYRNFPRTPLMEKIRQIYDKQELKRAEGEECSTGWSTEEKGCSAEVKAEFFHFFQKGGAFESQ